MDSHRSLVSSPSSCGSFPEKLLCPKSKIDKFLSCPISGDKLPDKRDIAV